MELGSTLEQIPVPSETNTTRPTRAVAILAWVLCGICFAAAIATVILLQLNSFGTYRATLMFAVAASAVMGALIASRRTANAVGWLLLIGALGFGLGDAALQYALYGLVTQPGALPFAYALSGLPTILNPLGGWCLLTFLPLLFPNGKPLSPFWRRIMLVVILLAIESIVASALLPGPVQGVAELSNPFGIHALVPLRDTIRNLNIVIMMGMLFTVVLGLGVRYHHSNRDERLQIKWLIFAVATWIALVLPSEWVEANYPQLFILLDMLIMLAFAGVPAAVGIAVLRYRLYDIDLIINRTLVYGALTLCIGAFYALVVVGIGQILNIQGGHALTLLATIVIAMLFAPVRDQLQRRVNRLLYGERDEPYTALTRLGQRLQASLAPDAVLPTIVQTVAETLRLPYAAIVLLSTDSHQSLIDNQTSKFNAKYGAIPSSLPPSHLVTLPLTYQGEDVGHLLLAPRARNEQLNDADWRLLRDLAHQAGAAIHAVQLTAALQAGLEEVRRSRERLVLGQEEERRRIQRDLHDGLGPVLASMRLRLEACLDQASTPELVHDLERLDALVGQATTDIRRLVYDLRPPALDQIGLVGALRQHITRWSRETNIQAELTATVEDPLAAAVEVTIFRITSEALTNIYKHAQASHVTVDLRRLGDALLLRIVDNGMGGATEPLNDGGTGIRSMRERAELLGGAVALRSRTGTGTAIEIYLPLRDETL